MYVQTWLNYFFFCRLWGVHTLRRRVLRAPRTAVTKLRMRQAFNWKTTLFLAVIKCIFSHCVRNFSVEIPKNRGWLKKVWIHAVYMKTNNAVVRGIVEFGNNSPNLFHCNLFFVKGWAEPAMLVLGRCLQLGILLRLTAYNSAAVWWNLTMLYFDLPWKSQTIV